ncbi:hypothetical protein EVAR_6302_1 [Eumeta japonica]|uniref:Uncharacterized protein n=1 Tax=Eumeta variegata TaxID=151549 RepID=A0A4C1TBF8_EUMVA|nr:hypothetical protein EVAR_6302_1 [Eumeta japonica]
MRLDHRRMCFQKGVTNTGDEKFGVASECGRIVTNMKNFVNATVRDNTRNFAAVKFVTKASQWRKIGTRWRRSKGRRAKYLRSISFERNWAFFQNDIY